MEAATTLVLHSNTNFLDAFLYLYPSFKFAFLKICSIFGLIKSKDLEIIIEMSPKPIDLLTEE